MSKALYVHIPFCKSICAYCDFCRVGYHKDLCDKYLTELNREAQFLKDKEFKTIYIGGGTPTSLDVEQLEKLLLIIEPFTKLVEEYTIEVNPETINLEKVKLLVKYKVNRVSIGVQTFSNNLLQIINRNHTEQDIYNCVRLFKENGINNISIDLMYGLPKQKIEDFSNSLKTAVSLDIPHISFYALTIEPNSEFGRKNIEALDSDLSDEMYFEGIKYLENCGYKQYEISNFAKEGYESKHNLVYWHYEDFDALGMGASGKIEHQRFTNTRNFIEYFNHNYKDEIIDLEKEDEMFETLMMGLRLKEGIDINEQILSFYNDKISNLVEKGYLELKGNHLKTLEKGYYILNDVLVDFL